MSLSPAQKKFLRSLGHSLKPIVTVGSAGVTPAVTAELDGSLAHHELVKIKLKSDRETRGEWIREISDRCQAEKVHVIGQVACFFRRNTRKPVIELPG